MKWIKVLKETLLFAAGYLALCMLFEYFSSEPDFSRAMIMKDSFIGIVVGFFVAYRHRNG